MFEASKDYSKARGKPQYDAGWQSDSTYGAAGAADVVWCSQCVCEVCITHRYLPPLSSPPARYTYPFAHKICSFLPSFVLLLKCTFACTTTGEEKQKKAGNSIKHWASVLLEPLQTKLDALAIKAS